MFFPRFRGPFFCLTTTLCKQVRCSFDGICYDGWWLPNPQHAPPLQRPAPSSIVFPLTAAQTRAGIRSCLHVRLLWSGRRGAGPYGHSRFYVPSAFLLRVLLIFSSEQTFPLSSHDPFSLSRAAADFWSFGSSPRLARAGRSPSFCDGGPRVEQVLPLCSCGN